MKRILKTNFQQNEDKELYTERRVYKGQCGKYGHHRSKYLQNVRNIERSTNKNKKFKNLALGNIPMGKAAKESDVATAVCFLASDAAAMITGSSILIDGGWTAK